jgi:hypothetical protein
MVATGGFDHADNAQVITGHRQQKLCYNSQLIHDLVSPLLNANLVNEAQVQLPFTDITPKKIRHNNTLLQSDRTGSRLTLVKIGMAAALPRKCKLIQ